MPIVIVTKGRTDRQKTLINLPRSLREQVVLVCPSREERTLSLSYPYVQNVLVQPDDSWTISPKRKWVVEHFAEKGHKKIIMLDDDLRFCIRRTDDPKKFLTATPEQVGQMFDELRKQLSERVPHAGLAARGGCISPKACEGGWQHAKRMMYVLGYHLPTLLRETEPFRLRSREDMDTSLQLLVKGYPNAVSYTYLVDTAFESKGGCLAERDFGKANEDARTLERLYPGLIRVVQKNDKGRAGLSDAARTRLEVVVQWEKALKQGQQRRAA